MRVSFAATHILTSPTKGSKGSLVGYSASGLPLYSFAGDALHKTSQSVLTIMKNMMRQILESSDSRRIFYFLCVNLVRNFIACRRAQLPDLFFRCVYRFSEPWIVGNMVFHHISVLHLCRVDLRGVDEQSRFDFRWISHVVRLFSPRNGSVRSCDEPLEGNEDIFIRVREQLPLKNFPKSWRETLQQISCLPLTGMIGWKYCPVL